MNYDAFNITMMSLNITSSYKTNTQDFLHLTFVI